jgi:hypothetical protein
VAVSGQNFEVWGKRIMMKEQEKSSSRKKKEARSKKQELLSVEKSKRVNK